MRLLSPAFIDGESIPDRYTCDGDDLSPPLEWSGVPEDCRSLALIVHDPDAPRGDWVHWVLYDIRPGIASLPEGRAGASPRPEGSVEGPTDNRKPGWGGPCPPSGTHRYVFSLYALDTVLGAGPALARGELLDAMEGHVLAQADLMGTYRREARRAERGRS